MFGQTFMDFRKLCEIQFITLIPGNSIKMNAATVTGFQFVLKSFEDFWSEVEHWILKENCCGLKIGILVGMQ